jgi:raffinose/stachyose/melibiose transport system permease protein
VTIRRASSQPGEPRLAGYLYVLPAAAVFILFVIYPLSQGAWLSLWHWDGLTPATWAGIDNYAEIIQDPSLRSAFIHSGFLTLFYTAAPIVLGLFVAVMLTHPRIRGVPFIRATLFLPQILPIVAVGIVWRWIFSPDGALNSALTSVGAGGLARGWLGDYTWALVSIGSVATWVVTGFCMVLFLVGIQHIPTELYDAARVDGARGRDEFRHVTLPGLRNELAVAVIVTTIAAFRSFDLIYVLTQGGPGDSSAVPSWQVYRRAFFYGEIGSAAALGITLAVIIFLIVIVLSRFQGERE